MITDIKIKPYNDITKQWINTPINKKGIYKEHNYCTDINNIKYYIDGKYVINDHTTSEKKIAKWFAKTKKCTVYMLPRILYPPKIKVADFISNNETWEIKEPIGNMPNTTIQNQFKHQKDKAKNFIIDIHNTNIQTELILDEIEKVYLYKRFEWIDTIIILNNCKLIKIFKRKNEVVAQT